MSARYLRLAHSHVTGVALSDTVLRFVKFSEHGDMAVPQHAAELKVPAGVLDNGRVINKQKFIHFLKTAKKIHHFDHINLVLISPQVQTFSISAKGAAPLYIKEAVEKMFGLPAKDILYEFHAVGSSNGITTFQVTTILKAVSQEFLLCFRAAGMTVLGIESIGHAVNRAVVPPTMHRSTLIINIDSDITTIVISVNGKVSQATMFAFGDDAFTQALIEKLGVTEAQAQTMKEEQGLMDKQAHAVFDALADDCVTLVRHINEEYIQWHTAHTGMPALEHIYVTGAGSTLKGLDEYIGIGLRVPVNEANVWANCLSFDEYVPILPQDQAVRYAAAVGVALVGNDSVNLLPMAHKQAMHRQHIMSVTAKIVLSFLLGAIVGYAVARVVAIPSVHQQFFDALHKIQARW